MVPEKKQEVAAAADAVTAELDVKTEDSWSLLAGGNDGLVIEISSDSDEDSSESGTCSSTSGEGESTDLGPDETTGSGDAPVVHGDAVQVKNTKTKIVHEVRSAEMTKEDVDKADIDSVKNCLTLCGHVVTGNYVVLHGSYGWAAKCRVCFKGSRKPN